MSATPPRLALGGAAFANGPKAGKTAIGGGIRPKGDADPPGAAPLREPRDDPEPRAPRTSGEQKGDATGTPPHIP